MKYRPYVVKERVKNKVDFYHVKSLVNYFLSIRDFKRRKWGAMQKKHFEKLKQLLDYVENTEYIWRRL